MRTIRYISILIVVALSAVTAQAAPKTFEELVAQAEAGDPQTDFTALRMAYAQSAGYDGYGMAAQEERQEFIRAANTRDCTKSIALSEVVLKADYTYPLAHLVRSVCFRKQGDDTRAGRERAIFQGLTQSILSSGDGKSLETAFVVVTMAEERFVLMNLGVDEQMQALVTSSGHNYDRIDGVNEKTGEKQSVYFNVDAMFGSLTRKLGNGQ